MRGRFLSPTLLMLVALHAQAAWVARIARIDAPNGIAAAGDAFKLSLRESLLTIDASGVIRDAVRLEPKKGRLQLEHMSVARDGFILTGVLIDEDPPLHRIRPIVIRVGMDGRPRWARAINVEVLTNRTFAVEATNGDMVVVSQHRQALLLARISGSGELTWCRTLDRSDWDLPQGIAATRDGGVVVAAGAHDRYAAVTRFRADGTIAWDRVIGTTDAGSGLYALAELPGGDLIAVGRVRAYNTGNRQGWILRLTKDGNIAWQKSIGGDGEDGLYRVVAGKDRILALGGTKSTARGDADGWLVAFDADGTIREQTAVGTEQDDGGALPQSYAAAIAASAEPIFVLQSHLALLAGSLSAASASCAVTRAVRLPESDFPATIMASPRVDEDFAPGMETVELLTQTASIPAAKQLCAFTPGRSPQPVETVAVAPPPETEIFAREVAALLRARNFAALDSLAAELRASRAAFESGQSKLHAFYEALARHHSLTALGADAHRQLLEAWQAAPDSATSRIARAAFDHAAAWNIRGGGFNNSIVPESAERFSVLTTHAAELLEEVEKSGKCDAACFHLQIDVHALGGWSEPLRKLHALDPTYWEAFPAAAVYLHPNWGGRAGAEVAFAESAADATKEHLGDTVYMKIMIRQPYAIGVNPPQRQYDWKRMRQGFADFQRLFPRSAANAHAFARLAYDLERDRETARALFATPLLAEFNPHVWRDRQEYMLARAWALQEPADAFAKDLTHASSGEIGRGWPRLVTTTRVELDDGASSHAHAFLVVTPAGLRGITVGLDFVTLIQNTHPQLLEAKLRTRIRAWTVGANGEKPLHNLDVVTGLGLAGAVVFEASTPVAAAFHPLRLATRDLRSGDRVFVVACTDVRAQCKQRVIAARFTSLAISPDGGAIENWRALAGAPVLDDTGAVAGVLMPAMPGHTGPPGIFELRALLSASTTKVTLPANDGR